MAEREIEQADDMRVRRARVSAVSWGLFFVWIGVAFLTDIAWGIGLIGIGVIALGAAGARWFLDLPVDWFWLMFGFVFVVWGLCESLNVRFSGGLLGILSIVAGLAMLAHTLLPSWRH